MRAMLMVLGLAAWTDATSKPSSAPPGPDRPAGESPMWVIQLKYTVNPDGALFLQKYLQAAAQAQAYLVVIELDTPGGLVESIRQMVGDILAAPLPVYVARPGRGPPRPGLS
ncbi:hypothetical protein DFAR_4000036 [Desulfarculales bacterium]